MRPGLVSLWLGQRFMADGVILFCTWVIWHFRASKAPSGIFLGSAFALSPERRGRTGCSFARTRVWQGIKRTRHTPTKISLPNYYANWSLEHDGVFTSLIPLNSRYALQYKEVIKFYWQL